MKFVRSFGLRLAVAAAMVTGLGSATSALADPSDPVCIILQCDDYCDYIGIPAGSYYRAACIMDCRTKQNGDYCSV